MTEDTSADSLQIKHTFDKILINLDNIAVFLNRMHTLNPKHIYKELIQMNRLFYAIDKHTKTVDLAIIPEDKHLQYTAITECVVSLRNYTHRLLLTYTS